MIQKIEIKSGESQLLTVIRSGNTPDAKFKQIRKSGSTAYYQDEVAHMDKGDRAQRLFAGVVKTVFTAGLGLFFSDAISDFRQGWTGKVEIRLENENSLKDEYTMKELLTDGFQKDNTLPLIGMVADGILNPSFYEEKGILLRGLHTYPGLYGKANEGLKNNEDFNLKAIEEGVSYSNLPENIKNDPKFAAKAFTIKPSVIYDIPVSLLTDDFLRRLYQVDPDALNGIERRIKNGSDSNTEKTFVIELLQSTDKPERGFYALPKSLKSDPAVISAAAKGLTEKEIKSNVLRYIGPELTQTPFLEVSHFIDGKKFEKTFSPDEVNTRAIFILAKSEGISFNAAVTQAKKELAEEYKAQEVAEKKEKSTSKPELTIGNE